MSNYRSTLKSQQTYSWTWNVMPLLIAAAALNALFLPSRTGAEESAAVEPIGIEAPTPAMLLVPSPQPGVGEPALVPADLPQSY